MLSLFIVSMVVARTQPGEVSTGEGVTGHNDTVMALVSGIKQHLYFFLK